MFVGLFLLLFLLILAHGTLFPCAVRNFIYLYYFTVSHWYSLANCEYPWRPVMKVTSSRENLFCQSKEITSVELFKAMQGLRVVCFFVVCFFNHPGNGSLGYKYTERVSCRISFSNLFISLWFSEYQGHVLFYNALVRDPWLGSFNFWFALTAKAFWWGASTLWRRVHDH